MYPSLGSFDATVEQLVRFDARSILSLLFIAMFLTSISVVVVHNSLMISSE